MSDPIDGWSRRGFLSFIGSLGGSMAVHEVMTAMGWMPGSGPAYAGPPRLAPGSGAGRLVAILGAGIGGLTAGFELLNAGYQVVIIEPQARAGGRNLTARRGTKIIEKSPQHGETEQTCDFDPGLSLNLGPGRLPYHHRRVLHYCRELGVPLEVYVMTTTANLWQRDRPGDNSPLLRRRLESDAMGYISELLAKQVCTGAELAYPLTEAERKQLLSLLVTFGDLNGAGTKCTIDRKEQACTKSGAYHYCGSTRAGCVNLNVTNTCKASDPIPLRNLLATEFWGGSTSFYQPLSFEWQPTLFQPVGGMDRIVEGFTDRIGSTILHNVRVDAIEVNEARVKIEMTNMVTKVKSSFFADYCVSNIPLPILSAVRTNFEGDFATAVNRARFQPTTKVGWQANKRFWEDDANQIYGGISYIDAPITQMWYPSNDYFAEKGTFTGAYNYGTVAEAFGRLTPEQRLREARQQGAKLHREIADANIVGKGISIAWQNVPYQYGGWAFWDPKSEEARKDYARLLAPYRKTFFVVGDQVSTLPGWQEGAMMSAEHVVEQIAGIRPLTVPDVPNAPDTLRLAAGLP